MSKKTDKAQALNQTAELVTDRPATIPAPTAGDKGTHDALKGKGVTGDKATARKRANAKGYAAQGDALAEVLIRDAIEESEREDKRKNVLRGYIKDIAALHKDAHVAFRARMDAELEMQRALCKAAGSTPKEMAVGGYSLASYCVLVSNWKTISTAIELGYKPDDGKGWQVTLAECVAMKHSVAAPTGKPNTVPQGDADETAGAIKVQIVGPAKKKAGRKAKPALEKALAACADMNTDELKMLRNWIDSKLTGGQKAAGEFWNKLNTDASAKK